MADILPTYYDADGTMHWDLVVICEVSYFEAAATKYMTRSLKKHEDMLQDVSKAATYLRKFATLQWSVQRPPRSDYVVSEVLNFIEASNIHPALVEPMTLAFLWRTRDDIRQAISCLDAVISEHMGAALG